MKTKTTHTRNRIAAALAVAIAIGTFVASNARAALPAKQKSEVQQQSLVVVNSVIGTEIALNEHLVIPTTAPNPNAFDHIVALNASPQKFAVTAENANHANENTMANANSNTGQQNTAPNRTVTANESPGAALIASAAFTRNAINDLTGASEERIQ
jgi:hypothetical protein